MKKKEERNTHTTLKSIKCLRRNQNKKKIVKKTKIKMSICIDIDGASSANCIFIICFLALCVCIFILIDGLANTFHFECNNTHFSYQLKCLQSGHQCPWWCKIAEEYSREKTRKKSKTNEELSKRALWVTSEASVAQIHWTIKDEHSGKNALSAQPKVVSGLTWYALHILCSGHW